MQTMKWDHDEIFREFSNCENLKDIIGQLEQKLWSQGEVICEIWVNDMFFDDRDEGKFSEATRVDIKKLEIKSRTIDHLYSETLASLMDFVPKIKDETLKIADEFRNGNIWDTQVRFREVLNGCTWISQVLGLMKNNLTAGALSETFTQGWADMETKTKVTVNELVHAFEARDFVLAADVLEYDLTSNLDNWLELLRSDDSIMDRVSAQKPSN